MGHNPQFYIGLVAMFETRGAEGDGSERCDGSQGTPK